MTRITNPTGAVLLLSGFLGPLGALIASVSLNIPDPMPVDKSIIAKGVRITRGAPVREEA